MQHFALPRQYAAPGIETTESEGEPHYGFTLTFRDRSRKSSFAILPDRISKPSQESAPRKVRVNHIMGRDTINHPVFGLFVRIMRSEPSPAEASCRLLLVLYFQHSQNPR